MTKRHARGLAVLATLWLSACAGRFDTNDPVFEPPDGQGGDSGDEDTVLVSPVPDFTGIQRLTPTTDGARLSWEPGRDDDDDPEDLVYRVYLEEGRATPDFSSPFLETESGENELVLTGLTPGQLYTLVVRCADTSGHEDGNRGEVMFVPGDVLYVDIAATGPAEDGLTPATAFRRIQPAIGAALSRGVPNLLVAEGTYEETLSLPGGVHLYGGFESDFDVRDRDPEANLTEICPGGRSGVLARAFSGPQPTLLSGIELDGEGTSSIALEAIDAMVGLHECVIEDTLGDGVCLIGTTAGGGVTARIHQSEVREAGAEGVVLTGGCDVSMTASTFHTNQNEGIEGELLTPRPGGASLLVFEQCDFFGNGNCGIDLDLFFDESAPLGGSFAVELTRCRAVGNAGVGILIDLDFKDENLIESSIEIARCEASANGLSGLLLDVDAATSIAVHHSIMERNVGEGLRVEGLFGRVSVSSSLVFGNTAQGIYVEEGAEVFVAQVDAYGNGGAAFDGIDDRTALLDCLSWLGPPVPNGPFRRFVAGRGGDRTLPDGPGLRRAPDAVDFVQIAPSPSQVGITLPELFAIDDIIEIDDDGIARQVTEVAGNFLRFEPALDVPARFGALVARWPEADDLGEDFLPESGSPLLAAGHPEVFEPTGERATIGLTGGPSRGPWGASGGLDSRRALRARRFEPAPGSVLAPGEAIVVTFSERPSPEERRVVLEVDGQPWDADVTLDGATLRITPTPAIPADSLVFLLLPGPSLTDPDRTVLLPDGAVYRR